MLKGHAESMFLSKWWNQEAFFSYFLQPYFILIVMHLKESTEAHMQCMQPQNFFDTFFKTFAEYELQARKQAQVP